jgi:TetR/AcrR family transcriptional regulator, cholesterol catabolism regulator
MRRGSGDPTRDRIIQATIELVSSQGPTAVSVRHIAEHAGVTKGAFYHHFDSKNAVFLEIYSILPNHFLRTVREIAAADFPAGVALLQIIEAVAHIVKDFRAETTVWIGELRMMRDTDTLDPDRLLDVNALTAETVELVSGILRRGVVAGEFHEVDDLQAIAFTVISMPVLVYSWLDVDRPVDPTRITRLFADLFLRGLFKRPPDRLSARR